MCSGHSTYIQSLVWSVSLKLSQGLSEVLSSCISLYWVIIKRFQIILWLTIDSFICCLIFLVFSDTSFLVNEAVLTFSFKSWTVLVNSVRSSISFFIVSISTSSEISPSGALMPGVENVTWTTLWWNNSNWNSRMKQDTLYKRNIWSFIL